MVRIVRKMVCNAL